MLNYLSPISINELRAADSTEISPGGGVLATMDLGPL